MSGYHAPFPLFNCHLQTIFPALFRRVRLRGVSRERISTPDNDFLDLDWLTGGNPGSPRIQSGAGQAPLIIISHGLEGNSKRAYVKGMARAFHSAGFDALLWNYRGCSDEMNSQLRFYHSGATDDLDHVVGHAEKKGYTSIFLIGFSLGGNLTLKYLGERSKNVRQVIKGTVTFSVPLNLDSSCARISERSNRLYALRFLKSLKNKVVSKSKRMSGIDVTGIGRIKNLRDFDDRYTAPLHGFPDADTYYRACSALHFLKGIAVPALIVNATNDPFLSADCFPQPSSFPHLTLEYPSTGGHVGFTLFGQNGLYWSELRALQFVTNIPA